MGEEGGTACVVLASRVGKNTPLCLQALGSLDLWGMRGCGWIGSDTQAEAGDFTTDLLLRLMDIAVDLALRRLNVAIQIWY